MKVITDITAMKKEHEPIVLAAGFFDGVHKGHRKVLSTTINKAKKISGKAWVLTFDNHPLKILNPDIAPPLLTSNDHKIRLFDETKISGCLLLPFTRNMSRIKPEKFITQLKENIPNLKEIIIGRNWRFGSGAKGTAIMLSRLCKKEGIKVTIVDPVIRKGEPISSTRIRMQILKGNLAEASTLLGRPFSIYGTVVRGRKLASTLGYPTANIEPSNEVMPPYGVYAVIVFYNQKILDGVMNYGIRPTFPASGKVKPVIEVFLLNFEGELYGKQIEVMFVEKLRDERKFASQEELKKQIGMDVRLAKALLGHPVKNH